MAFAEEVKKVFTEHRRRYGARRISKELQAQGLSIGRHQTTTLMRQQELKAIQPKSFVPKTTNSNHRLGRSPNLLLDRPVPSRPGEVLVGDITYIPLAKGSFLYLACWQDMFSRVIVGWELADHMRSILVENALNKAINRKALPKGLLVHSDGGGQYASEAFRNLLRQHEFLQSMTRKDNQYDKAMGESLFSRFKAELLEKGPLMASTMPTLRFLNTLNCTTTENADIRQSATKYLNCLSKNGMLRKLLASLVKEL